MLISNALCICGPLDSPWRCLIPGWPPRSVAEGGFATTLCYSGEVSFERKTLILYTIIYWKPFRSTERYPLPQGALQVIAATTLGQLNDDVAGCGRQPRWSLR